MTPGARVAAAIDVIGNVEQQRRPAPDALKDWGQRHRFAGSGDRAAIAGLVYDTLRRRASSAFIMDDDAPRALVLGMLACERGLDPAAITALADGSGHAPPPLSETERRRLEAPALDGAPAHILGDYPEWLDSHFATVFGDERADEGARLSERAGLDLRVNAIKCDRDRAEDMLSDHAPEPTSWSPAGLRIALRPGGKNPAVKSESAFLKGFVEVQDEGSQLAVVFAAAKPGNQVIDLCAGAGGKTLALAAAMKNQGQIYATDSDKRRLAPIHDRLTRSGARNVQVRAPKSIGTEMDDLAGRADLVLIDAPCTGTGSWRRNPDAKWRMRPGALEQRVKDQHEVLDAAVRFVKPGGRIAYVTCSVLDEENGAQIRAFIGRHPDFGVVPPADVIAVLGERAFLFKRAALLNDAGLLMTPRRTNTDGFFVSVLTRQ